MTPSISPSLAPVSLRRPTRLSLSHPSLSLFLHPPPSSLIFSPCFFFSSSPLSRFFPHPPSLTALPLPPFALAHSLLPAATNQIISGSYPWATDSPPASPSAPHFPPHHTLLPSSYLPRSPSSPPAPPLLHLYLTAYLHTPLAPLLLSPSLTHRMSR